MPIAIKRASTRLDRVTRACRSRKFDRLRGPIIGKLALCVLLWSGAGDAQSPQPAQPASSQLARFSFVSQSSTVKVLDGPVIPFNADSGPVFDITNLHVVATKQANGVFVETRFTGSPYKRHSAEGGTPLVVTLKSGDRTLAALSAIDWTVTCFRTDIFGAKTLLPGVEFERIEAVEIAPMQALARVCVSPPVHRERKKKGS